MGSYSITSGSIDAYNSVGMSWVVRAYPDGGETGTDELVDLFSSHADMSEADWADRYELERDGFLFNQLGDWEVSEGFKANTYTAGNLCISNKLLREFIVHNVETGKEERWLGIAHNFSDPRGAYTDYAFFEVEGHTDESAMWLWVEDLEPKFGFYLKFVDGSKVYGWANNSSDTYDFQMEEDTVVGDFGSMADQFYEEFGGRGWRDSADDAINKLLYYGELS